MLNAVLLQEAIIARVKAAFAAVEIPRYKVAAAEDGTVSAEPDGTQNPALDENILQGLAQGIAEAVVEHLVNEAEVKGTAFVTGVQSGAGTITAQTEGGIS